MARDIQSARSSALRHDRAGASNALEFIGSVAIAIVSILAITTGEGAFVTATSISLAIFNAAKTISNLGDASEDRDLARRLRGKAQQIRQRQRQIDQNLETLERDWRDNGCDGLLRAF